MKGVLKNRCWIVFYFELREFQIILEVFKLKKNTKSSKWCKRSRKKQWYGKIDYTLQNMGLSIFARHFFVFYNIF